MKSSNDGASIKQRDSIKEASRSVMTDILPKLQSKYKGMHIDAKLKGYNPFIKIGGKTPSGQYASFTIGVSVFTKKNTNYGHYGLTISEIGEITKGFSNTKDLINEIKSKLK